MRTMTTMSWTGSVVRRRRGGLREVHFKMFKATRPDVPWVSSYKLIVSYSRVDHEPMIYLFLDLLGTKDI
jgi:hypothetical protein